jgi:RNA polymerase sigma-70 factor (ECF subfamily)
MAVEKKAIFFPEQEELFKERTGKEFSFFYQKYYPKLLYYTSKMCQSARLDPAKAEDISTDSFLIAFEKIDKYEREKSQFSTWLFTIAKNLMLQEIKSDQKTLSMDVEVDEEGTTMKDFLQEEESEQHIQDLIQMKAEIMLQRISELKEPYKQVIEMREIQKMAYKDIADQLGKNLSTIKSQIRNGRAILIAETEKEFLMLDEMYK